eukprot:TRINITY_DN13965_c0_g1_i1.p1 TRINITY_DN13965_c0_g1~~TRINITY_DN13965_c0_g1_i1.p1  ORF type:complete len:417 (+),score=72.60 TRINITY_DN13965_c0_g1_i1:47-1297(+)
MRPSTTSSISATQRPISERSNRPSTAPQVSWLEDYMNLWRILATTLTPAEADQKLQIDQLPLFLDPTGQLLQTARNPHEQAQLDAFRGLVQRHRSIVYGVFAAPRRHSHADERERRRRRLRKLYLQQKDTVAGPSSSPDQSPPRPLHGTLVAETPNAQLWRFNDLSAHLDADADNIVARHLIGDQDTAGAIKLWRFHQQQSLPARKQPWAPEFGSAGSIPSPTLRSLSPSKLFPMVQHYFGKPALHEQLSPAEPVMLAVQPQASPLQSLAARRRQAAAGPADQTSPVSPLAVHPVDGVADQAHIVSGNQPLSPLHADGLHGSTTSPSHVFPDLISQPTSARLGTPYSTLSSPRQSRRMQSLRPFSPASRTSSRRRDDASQAGSEWDDDEVEDLLQWSQTLSYHDYCANVLRLADDR